MTIASISCNSPATVQHAQIPAPQLPTSPCCLRLSARPTRSRSRTYLPPVTPPSICSPHTSTSQHDRTLCPLFAPSIDRNSHSAQHPATPTLYHVKPFHNITKLLPATPQWDALSTAHLLLMETAVTAGLFITVGFWLGIVLVTKAPVTPGISNYMKHAGTCVLLLLEVLLTRLPFVSYHLQVTVP
jgi:hypothetical protein